MVKKIVRDPFFLQQKSEAATEADMKTVEDLNRARMALHRLETSFTYRAGQFFTWLPNKIAGGIRNLREHGFRYTVSLFFRKFGISN